MAGNANDRHWGTGRAARVVAFLSVAAALFLTIALASGHIFAIDNDMLLLLRQATDLQQPTGPHWLLNAFENFTSLGSSAVTGLILAIAIVATIAVRDYRSGLYLALVYAGAQILSNGAKVLIARPRPEIVPHLVDAGGFSFPSGHSTLSAGTYLALGLLIAGRQSTTSMRVLVLLAAATPIALVGFSRIYLGVHYPTDVLGGWLIGASWALTTWVTGSRRSKGND
jgi:undecaprenyl-diphosphatase